MSAIVHRFSTLGNNGASISVMANAEDGAGPATDRVAANVRAVRRDRGLDLADLSTRLEKLGQPLGVNALSKIELRKRRVDVDDLLALALALDVTPNRLLLTEGAGAEDVALTKEYAARTGQVWRWATGDEPLPDAEPWSDRHRFVFDRERTQQFQEENRPHAPAVEGLTTADLEEHAQGLGIIMRAIQEARDHGVPMAVIRGWFRLDEAMQSLANKVRRDLGASSPTQDQGPEAPHATRGEEGK
jgi:transcriptional regulator with XRE-family HTH domain